MYQGCCKREKNRVPALIQSQRVIHATIDNPEIKQHDRGIGVQGNGTSRHEGKDDARIFHSENPGQEGAVDLAAADIQEPWCSSNHLEMAAYLTSSEHPICAHGKESDPNLDLSNVHCQLRRPTGPVKSLAAVDREMFRCQTDDVRSVTEVSCTT